MSISKIARSEEWEHEVLKKEEDKLTKFFSEFIEHRKTNNVVAAKQIAEILIRKIPNFTSEMAKLFNMDAKEEIPSDFKVEKTVEKLKIWSSILRNLVEYVGSAHQKSEKYYGPVIKKKPMPVAAAVGGKNMLVQLYKLATTLDEKGEFDLSDEIDQVIKTIAERAGVSLKDMVSLANYFDEVGETKLADQLDEMLKEAKKSYKEFKGKGQKKPTKHRPKPPKAWLEKMVKDMLPGVKKRFPKVNEKEAKRRAAVEASNVWHNDLSDAKVESLLKKYKK